MRLQTQDQEFQAPIKGAFLLNVASFVYKRKTTTLQSGYGYFYHDLFEMINKIDAMIGRE